MPMPVYFIVGEREVSLTDDEAQKVADRLPQETLQNHIMMRIGENISTPVRMDVGGDEHANLVAVYEAIQTFEDDDLTPAIKSLRRSAIVAMGERSWRVSLGDGRTATYRGPLPDEGSLIDVAFEDGSELSALVTRLTLSDDTAQLHATDSGT